VELAVLAEGSFVNSIVWGQGQLGQGGHSMGALLMVGTSDGQVQVWDSRGLGRVWPESRGWGETVKYRCTSQRDRDREAPNALNAFGVPEEVQQVMWTCSDGEHWGACSTDREVVILAM
jgi:WD40 repeat protein